MSDEAMGDDVYQPEDSDYGGGDDRTDIDMDNALEEKRTDEILDEGYSPPERPLAVNDDAVTVRGQRDGQTLDEELREEEPDVREPEGNGIGDQPGMAGEPLADELSGERRAGRIVKDDYARSADPVARDVGINGGAASAEEAAVHIARESEEEAPEEGDDEEPAPDFAPGDPRGGGER